MEDMRVIFASVKSVPKNTSSSYGIEIVLDDNREPLGMRYWSNAGDVCGFCGSLEGMCVHGPFIEAGIMIGWDVRCLSRRIIAVEHHPPSGDKWWKFNDESKEIVKKWLADQST